VSPTERNWQDRASASPLQQLITAPEESPKQAAYRRLLEHGSSCATCLAVNEEGENANLPCETGDRLYEEYRKAWHGPA
jgi:hypothetical protein